LELANLSAAVGSDFKDLKERNPQFIRDFIPPGQHTVFVPAGSGLTAVRYLQSKSEEVTRAKLVRSERNRIERH
jgi:hypothetical protein